MAAAVCILSGGQDSTTVLFDMKQRYDPLYAITFDYGQKHAVEMNAAMKVAAMAGVKEHRVSTLSDLLSSSPLVNPEQKLEEYKTFDAMVGVIGDRTEVTFVPMRNLLFLTMAANYAKHVGAKVIGLGVSEEDTANYPDCRASFIFAAELAIQAALKEDMTIYTPLITLSKANSVRLALCIPGCYKALAYSHTAYSGEYPPVTQDHATVLRAEGFRRSGVPDPMIVRAYLEGKLDNLPDTDNYSKHALDMLYQLKGDINFKLDILCQTVGAA